MNGYRVVVRVIDRNDRDTTILVNTDIARDAAHVLAGMGREHLSVRINTACRGMRPISDSTLVIPTVDMDDVTRAIRAVA